MNAIQLSMVNRHPETHIAYGLISSQHLHSEIVDTLLYGIQATNHSYDEYCLELAHGAGFDPTSTDAVEARLFLEDTDCYAALEGYEESEPLISGVHEGVSYQTTYIGGALHFWIFESPVITKNAQKASPCVPNAAILDTLDGSEEGYDVPADWRYEEDLE